MRVYANQTMTGNVQEQQRLNALIEKLQLEVAHEKTKVEKYQEDAKRSSSISGSQTTSSSDAELMAQIEELQREKKQLQLDIASEQLKTEKYREEAKQASSSSGSQTTGTSETDLMAQIEELQRERMERGFRRDEEIKASDDAITHVKEQLQLAKDQARIASDAKKLAEDELGLMHSSSEPSSTSGSGARSVEVISDDLKKKTD